MLGPADGINCEKKLPLDLIAVTSTLSPAQSRRRLPLPLPPLTASYRLVESGAPAPGQPERPPFRTDPLWPDLKERLSAKAARGFQ